MRFSIPHCYTVTVSLHIISTLKLKQLKATQPSLIALLSPVLPAVAGKNVRHEKGLHAHLLAAPFCLREFSSHLVRLHFWYPTCESNIDKNTVCWE